MTESNIEKPHTIYLQGTGKKYKELAKEEARVYDRLKKQYLRMRNSTPDELREQEKKKRVKSEKGGAHYKWTDEEAMEILERITRNREQEAALAKKCLT